MIAVAILYSRRERDLALALATATKHNQASSSATPQLQLLVSHPHFPPSITYQVAHPTHHFPNEPSIEDHGKDSERPFCVCSKFNGSQCTSSLSQTTAALTRSILVESDGEQFIN